MNRELHTSGVKTFHNSLHWPKLLSSINNTYASRFLFTFVVKRVGRCFDTRYTFASYLIGTGWCVPVSQGQVKRSDLGKKYRLSEGAASIISFNTHFC